MAHQYTRQATPSVPIADALRDAAMRVSATKVVKVTRRRGRKDPLAPTALSLPSYVAFRRSQGVQEHVAVDEWDGAQRLAQR